MREVERLRVLFDHLAFDQTCLNGDYVKELEALVAEFNDVFAL